VGGVIFSVPEAALVPVHAPDARQVVAFVVDQVSVVLPPASTVLGLAEMVTVVSVVTEAAAVRMGAAAVAASMSAALNAMLRENIDALNIFFQLREDGANVAKTRSDAICSHMATGIERHAVRDPSAVRANRPRSARQNTRVKNVKDGIRI
jgi:hypothetical protein